MPELQEFRDRCAKAMGWEIVVVPYQDHKLSVKAEVKRWGYPGVPLVVAAQGDGWKYWTTKSSADWDKEVAEQYDNSVGIYYGDPATRELMCQDQWNPDTSFDAAAMLRDKCLTVYQFQDTGQSVFAQRLREAIDGPDTAFYRLAFATARQIAEAALTVLEKTTGVAPREEDEE